MNGEERLTSRSAKRQLGALPFFSLFNEKPDMRARAFIKAAKGQAKPGPHFGRNWIIRNKRID